MGLGMCARECTSRLCYNSNTESRWDWNAISVDGPPLRQHVPIPHIPEIALPFQILNAQYILDRTLLKYNARWLQRCQSMTCKVQKCKVQSCEYVLERCEPNNTIWYRKPPEPIKCQKCWFHLSHTHTPNVLPDVVQRTSAFTRTSHSTSISESQQRLKLVEVALNPHYQVTCMGCVVINMGK